MWVKPFTALIAAAIAAAPSLSAAELGTLFTTPEERQIINNNRYRREERPVAPVAQAEIETPAQVLAREEVTRRYRISGITLAVDGTPTVWLNSRAYPDGARLDDGSRIDVEKGAEIRVRITAPDGSRHYGLSGESVEVTYLAPVESP